MGSSSLPGAKLIVSARVEIERPFTFAYPAPSRTKKGNNYFGRVLDREEKLYVDRKVIKAFECDQAFYIMFRNRKWKTDVQEGMTTRTLVQKGLGMTLEGFRTKFDASGRGRQLVDTFVYGLE